MVKRFLEQMWIHAMDMNQSNILNLLSKVECGDANPRFLDLGCDDGQWTMECAKKVGATIITGVDIVDERLNAAADRGVNAIHSDLDGKISIPDESQDIVHANQVIEHVGDIDNFASEIFRVLKPGGSAVISTENASSWCNIFAQAMGWQMFSLTNLSSLKSGIGNPLAIHRDESVELSSWTHKTIFSYRGLIEFFEAHGFRVLSIRGAGYFPLPASVARLDVRHARFLAILAWKPHLGIR